MLIFLANFSYHEVVFPEYSRKIPGMSISKKIPKLSVEHCKVMKLFLEVKKFKKLSYGLSCENFNIGNSSLAMFFWTLLKPLYI